MGTTRFTPTARATCPASTRPARSGPPGSSPPRAHASSGKPEHRNSETSTRSSSTPSIPQSLAENGLEPFDGTAVIWVDSVALNLRPGPFRDGAADADGTLMLALGPGEGATGPRGGGGFPEDALPPADERRAAAERVRKLPEEAPKSADTWGEDSLEFSLSDLSQEHLTSTEEIADTADERDFPRRRRRRPRRHARLRRPHAGPADRAGSLDRLCAQKSPAHKQPRNRYAKYGGREGAARRGRPRRRDVPDGGRRERLRGLHPALPPLALPVRGSSQPAGGAVCWNAGPQGTDHS
ncbi:hypothetical protein ANANG_G00164430 [Anguilla anguilla]|uniref:Uncharacterized protein n=1 Tax=Anguilla anguilla TaxID=7936 RepID=A0A9D3RVI0_ANGAN|nr:hypothetical protein ANANG_G00164430 [Anguilla anguilla]